MDPYICRVQNHQWSIFKVSALVIVLKTKNLRNDSIQNGNLFLLRQTPKLISALWARSASVKTMVMGVNLLHPKRR